MLHDSEQVDNAIVVDDKKVVECIKQIKEAQLCIRQYLNRRIDLEPTPQDSEAQKVRLNPREYEILFLMFLGKSHFEIAKYLSKIHGERAGWTVGGFKIWMHNRLGVRSDEELVNKALELDLIHEIPESFKIIKKVS